MNASLSGQAGLPSDLPAPSGPAEQGPELLASVPATERDRRIALVICTWLVAAFVVTTPFAAQPLLELRGFVPAFDAAVTILDAITSVLLYSQYRELRRGSLLVLASGFAFTPVLIAGHSLGFPDAFVPGSLIGGPQTTAWLWMAWHGLFPLFVCAYAVMSWYEVQRGKSFMAAPRRAAPAAFAAAIALAAAITLATVMNQSHLPQLMIGNLYQSLTTKWILALGWLANLAAFVLVLRLTRVQRRLDLWIAVMMLAALIDLGLSAILVTGRYQVGFYVGRFYGLLASSIVVGLLLLETFRMQARLVRAFDAVKGSEARFRALVDVSPVYVWQLDANGNLIFVNRRCIEQLGLPMTQLAGAHWEKVVHPDDLPQFAKALSDAVRDRSGFQARVRVRHRDDRWRWLDSHAAPWFATPNDYRGHVGIAIDITDAVQAEDALKETNRRKDEFLAALAHELRNPLAPINNALYLLRQVDTGKRRMADTLIDMMDRQVVNMTRLVDDLLEISRITNGKIELIKGPVDLVDVIRHAIETSTPAIERGRHRLTLDLPDEPLWIEADVVRMNQIVSNLLNNAAKYTNDGGDIVVTARRDDGQAIVSVRDNGIGIPSEMLGDVFEMFRQVPGSAHKGQGGLGIGLSMSQHLAHLHGGRIEAHSEGVGKGSEFIVRLPLFEGDEPSRGARKPAVVPGTAPLSGCSVLVVDDNADAADTLAVLLETEGADVHVVHDGSSALAKLEHYRPDAIVLDIGLPDISGYEVAQRIRGRHDLRDVRLIALTGWGQDDDRSRSRDSGFNEHLTKPVDFSVLETLLMPAVK